MGNAADLFAARLREVGERLIRDSETIVGDDPSTREVNIDITLIRYREWPVKVNDYVKVEISKDISSGSELS